MNVRIKVPLCLVHLATTFHTCIHINYFWLLPLIPCSCVVFLCRLCKTSSRNNNREVGNEYKMRHWNLEQSNVDLLIRSSSEEEVIVLPEPEPDHSDLDDHSFSDDKIPLERCSVYVLLSEYPVNIWFPPHVLTGPHQDTIHRVFLPFSPNQQIVFI